VRASIVLALDPYQADSYGGNDSAAGEHGGIAGGGARYEQRFLLLILIICLHFPERKDSFCDALF